MTHKAVLKTAVCALLVEILQGLYQATAEHIFSSAVRLRETMLGKLHRRCMVTMRLRLFVLTACMRSWLCAMPEGLLLCLSLCLSQNGTLSSGSCHKGHHKSRLQFHTLTLLLNFHPRATITNAPRAYDASLVAVIDSAGPPHRRSSTSPSTTQKIRSINKEAQKNDMIKERLDHWKAEMR